MQMEIRGWLLNAVPLEIIEAWVGDDVRRARLVASITPVGGEEPIGAPPTVPAAGDQPTPVARFLLSGFSEDREVASSLWAQFVSGFWTGPESERIAGQIEQLNRWRRRPDEPLGVRTWARDMVRDLEVRRRAALEREAEREI
jgi:hypothetical protein